MGTRTGLLLPLLSTIALGATSARGAPTNPRIVLQRGDTGPQIMGSVTAIDRLVGLDH